MDPHLVVEALNVLEDLQGCLFVRLEHAELHALGLDEENQRLHRGIACLGMYLSRK